MTATKSPSRTQLVCHHKQAGLVFITKVGLARHPYQSACPPANILLNQLDVHCGIKCLDFVVCNSQKALWFQWSVSVCQLQADCVVCVIYTTASSLTKAWQSSRTTGVSKERPGTGCFLLIYLVSYCGGFWFCGLSISDSKTVWQLLPLCSWWKCSQTTRVVHRQVHSSACRTRCGQECHLLST